jgi:hypothetical protein
MDDDLMPNNGEFFFPREPQDQIIARKKEQAKTLEAKKELEKIVDHFSERIKATDSIQNALEIANEYKVSKETAIVVMDMVCKQLEDERRRIAELIDIYIK